MKLIARALGTNLPSNQKVDLAVLEKLEKNNIAVGDSLLTQEKNLEVFDYLCKLFKQKCYCESPGSVANSFDSRKGTHRDVLPGVAYRSANTIVLQKMMSACCLQAFGSGYVCYRT
jgi:hypothetical protein